MSKAQKLKNITCDTAMPLKITKHTNAAQYITNQWLLGQHSKADTKVMPSPPPQKVYVQL